MRGQKGVAGLCIGFPDIGGVKAGTVAPLVKPGRRFEGPPKDLAPLFPFSIIFPFLVRDIFSFLLNSISQSSLLPHPNVFVLVFASDLSADKDQV